MSKITLTYEKTEYTLEYNRQSVKTLEAQGFVLDELTSKPMTMIPLLFYGAFFKNHRGVKRKTVDEIFESLNEKSALLEALMEMYIDTMSTLTDSTEGEGNVSWAVTK